MIKGCGNQIVGREVVVKTLRIRKDLFSKRCKGTHFDRKRAQSIAEQAVEGDSGKKWPGTDMLRIWLSISSCSDVHLVLLYFR